MKKCPYCAEEIQDDAIICKHCKSNLKEGGMPVSTQTIELTSKRYKKQYLYSFLGFFVGMILISKGSLGNSNATLMVGVIIAIVAVVVIIITKFEIWWHHK